MAMMIFEAYGFIRAGFHAEFSECNHRIDSLSFALLFILHMFIFIVVILEAAGVTVTVKKLSLHYFVVSLNEAIDMNSVMVFSRNTKCWILYEGKG